MDQLPALSLAGSTRYTHIFSRVLMFGFLAVAVFVAVAPWQQFVTGSGKVIAFDPLDRRVNVEALVSGRVKSLNIVEGQRVKAGQLLAEIQDNDPNLLKNLDNQRLAAINSIDFAKSRVETLTTQMAQQEMAKAQALNAAQEKISAAKIASETAALDYTRVSALYKKDLASRREYEQAILKRDSTLADFRSAQASMKQTENSFDSTITSIKASQESAKSSIASAEKDLTSLTINVSQNERQQITAPRDGFVLSVPVTDGTYLKPGSLICVIIPETEKRFAEVWVDGNDVPLVKARKEVDGKVIPGSPVRLVFEGWPALQSIGWPSLAVGTFGGEVIVVDSTDDGTGLFRVVVAPVEDQVDRNDGEGVVNVSWPAGDRWLRQGVLTNAWIMLDEVPLWFELWRQVNGFPTIGKGIESAPTSKK